MEGAGCLCSVRGYEEKFLARFVLFGISAKERSEGTRSDGREAAPRPEQGTIYRELIAA